MSSKVKHRYIIGIDEVGRGALAGPVVVATLAVPTKLRIENAELRIKKKSMNSELAKLKDSKKLSPKQREAWFEYIKNLKISYATASVQPKIIDKINISNAANLAATRALKKLLNSLTIVKLLSKREVRVFLDGGLYLNKSKIKNKKLKTQIKNTKTIVRGDEKVPAITLASIVAKVTRDRMMIKLHKKYPKYNFNQHKGYGTKKHFKAIKKHGPTKIHRLTFLKKMVKFSL